MADGDRPVLLKQKQPHRLSDDIRTSDHNAGLTGNFDAGTPEQFHQYKMEGKTEELLGN